MSDVGGVAGTIGNLLSKGGQDEATAMALGNKVDNIETLLDLAYGSDSIENLMKTEQGRKAVEAVYGTSGLSAGATIDGLRNALNTKLQRAMAALQGFMQMIKARFDIMKEGIRNLSAR